MIQDGHTHEPDFGRLTTAFHLGEPDRVPLIEATVDYQVMSQYMRRDVTADDLQAQVDFWRSAGYDCIPLSVGMLEPGKVTEDSPISRVLKASALEAGDGGADPTWNIEQHAWLRTLQDVERFPWDKLASPDLHKLAAVQSCLPEGMRIIAVGGKVFTLSWLLMGFEHFAVSTVVDPGLVEAVVGAVGRIQVEAMRRAVQVPNVGAVWIVDDLAFGTGPMLRPEAFRRFIFPWYEELASIAGEHRLPLLFHTDGYVWDLMDDLIYLGVNALHPIDPTCMDIEEVKARFGRRLCLMGNISNDLLARGSLEEVRELTLRRIKALAPGGGYVMAAGNSVPGWTNVDNYRAMIDTTMRHGRYPISA